MLKGTRETRPIKSYPRITKYIIILGEILVLVKSMVMSPLTLKEPAFNLMMNSTLVSIKLFYFNGASHGVKYYSKWVAEPDLISFKSLVL